MMTLTTGTIVRGYTDGPWVQVHEVAEQDRTGYVRSVHVKVLRGE
jgi:hypothetical protein